MSTTETGDATNYPASITIPSDGDGPSIKAADVNVAFEGLADRTANLNARLRAINAYATEASFTSTSPTTWTAGPNDREVELDGYGAGGGGGGGAAGGAFDTSFSCGGGGGGAPIRRRVRVSVTPGAIYEVVCGSGGLGGTGGAFGGTPEGGDGSSGGDTIFRVQAGATLATFPGAAGGKGGHTAPSSSDYFVAAGGSPTVQDRPDANVDHAERTVGYCYGPGFGGDGTAKQTSQTTRKGASSDRKSVV